MAGWGHNLTHLHDVELRSAGTDIVHVGVVVALSPGRLSGRLPAAPRRRVAAHRAPAPRAGACRPRAGRRSRGRCGEVAALAVAVSLSLQAAVDGCGAPDRRAAVRRVDGRRRGVWTTVNNNKLALKFAACAFLPRDFPQTQPIRFGYLPRRRLYFGNNLLLCIIYCISKKKMACQRGQKLRTLLV